MNFGCQLIISCKDISPFDLEWYIWYRSLSIYRSVWPPGYKNPLKREQKIWSGVVSEYMGQWTSQNEGYFKVSQHIPSTLLSTGEKMQNMLKYQELSYSREDRHINIIIIRFCKRKQRSLQKNLQRCHKKLYHESCIWFTYTFFSIIRKMIPLKKNSWNFWLYSCGV